LRFLRELRVDFDDRPEFFPDLTVPMERVKTMKIKSLLTGKSRKAMGGEGGSVRVLHFHLQFPRKILRHRDLPKRGGGV